MTRWCEGQLRPVAQWPQEKRVASDTGHRKLERVTADRAARERFGRDGFVVLPRYLSEDDLSAAVATLPVELPTADEFHDDFDPERSERFRDEFGGITTFPYTSTSLSLAAVHERLIDPRQLASWYRRPAGVLDRGVGETHGAADYDQPLHRDYLNHSLLVPDADQPPQQVEMFLYLCDVPVELGPSSYVPTELTADLPSLPNWYRRQDGVADDNQPRWVSEHGRPDLYERERRAAGPAGTVVAYSRRSTAGPHLASPGSRYTIHTNVRRGDADWMGRRAWVDTANTPRWRSLVTSATTRQLELFGFPPSGHRHWTDRTAAGLQQRYPGLDTDRWMKRQSLSPSRRTVRRAFSSRLVILAPR